MKTVNEFLEEWGMMIIIPLIMIMFFRTCNTSNNVDEIKIIAKINTKKIDSVGTMVGTIVITEDEMVKLIKETPAWETLRLEEISDKEHISINALKEKNK